MSLNTKEELFFNFEVLSPIVTFGNQDLPSVVSSLYDYGLVPMHIFTDKRNPVFSAIVDNRPKGSTPFESVIIPIRYLKTFTT